MSKINQAKELLTKASKLKGSRAVFLRELAEPLRKQINDIRYDRMLSEEGRTAKKKELKEAATKEFMKKVALRKQEYQHYLNKAKKLASETIEKSFVSADETTRAKFNRDFSELKFKMALKDEKGAFKEVKSFVEKTQASDYASLLLENFHELVGNFKDHGLKAGLSTTYNKLKVDFTPEEVSQALNVIETVDGTIDDKMFTIMMPGDNPATNVDYSIISELFTQDALRFYQEPEAYFAKYEDEPIPVYVDPSELAEKLEEKQDKQKSKVDQMYDNIAAVVEQKFRDGELKSYKNGGE